MPNRSRHSPIELHQLCLLLLSLLGSAAPNFAQEPVVQHQALECLPNNQFPQLDAAIQPGAEVQTAKVYFRSQAYPDFYYVLMKRPEAAASLDLFQAILPKPSPDTARVVYYIEAVNRAYQSGRSGENTSQVSSDEDCRRRDPAAAFFTGGRPGIVVGATRVGAASLPPGFQAAGIVSFISAVGAASATGGGIGTGTAALIGAGAAAAVGGAVAVGGGGGSSTTTTVSAATTTSTTTTTVAPTTSTTSVPVFNEAPRACFTFNPDPPIIDEGESVTFDASCSVGDRTLREDTVESYDWDFGDGQAGRGRRVTHTYPRVGFYVVKLTVTDQGGRQDTATVNVHVEGSLKACFTVSNPVDVKCDVTFDAGCSTGKITQYDWVFDTTGILGGPFPFPDAGPVFVKNFPPCPSFPFPSTHELTVHAGGATSTTSMTFIVLYLRGQEQGSLPTSFASFLQVSSAESAPLVHLLVNGAALQGAEPGVRARHPLTGQPGENTVEAFLSSSAASEGLWRFDFSATDRFTPGSIQVESGEVVSVEGISVVFRLAGGGPARIRFKFKLAP